MRRRWRSLTPSRSAIAATLGASPSLANSSSALAAWRASVREASITVQARPGPGAISGRHFRQGRNDAASACAGDAKKRQLRRAGMRTRQIGRQYTPVDVTPTKSRPSKRASCARSTW